MFVLLQGDASAPSQTSNGVDAFEQIAVQNEKGDSRSDSPLPISVDSGKCQVQGSSV